MTEKGVIIDYDFAAFGGAEVLFRATKDFLKKLDGIAFDASVEAKCLAGKLYSEGLAKHFSAVKTKKTAAKAGRDLSAAIEKALGVAIAKTPVTPSFRNFLKVLSDKGVGVVLVTQAVLKDVAETFAPVLSDSVQLRHLSSTAYGAMPSAAWRHLCLEAELKPFNTLAVVGSGFSVRSALMAGLSSIAVVNDRVAYQDFSGANAVVNELGAPAAKKVLEILRLS